MTWKGLLSFTARAYYYLELTGNFRFALVLDHRSVYSYEEHSTSKPLKFIVLFVVICT